jgi:ankyrin repeat protein
VADVNGYLPIHKAAMEGHLAIIKELVAGGSPVRPQNNEGVCSVAVCTGW